jgi:hypothetical protein
MILILYPSLSRGLIAATRVTMNNSDSQVQIAEIVSKRAKTGIMNGESGLAKMAIWLDYVPQCPLTLIAAGS